jgi:hypothetical protein
VLDRRTRVVVYGNTLNLAGIAASLKAEASLEIICVDPQNSTARQSLNALDPETIIFDRSDPHTALDLALLREQPGLLLVGVDPSSNEALVMSGQLTRVLSCKDLARVVSAQAMQPRTEEELNGDEEESRL